MRAALSRVTPSPAGGDREIHRQLPTQRTRIVLSRIADYGTPLGSQTTPLLVARPRALSRSLILSLATLSPPTLT